MKFRVSLTGGLVAFGLLTANVASANLLTFYGSYSPQKGGSDIYYNADDARGDLSCSALCYGLTSDLISGTYPATVPGLDTRSDDPSDSFADLFVLANNGDAFELAFVNAVVDDDFLSGTKTAVDDDSKNAYTFVSAATYILFKIGKSPDIALIYNPTGDVQTYSYHGFSGKGAGLSHYVEFGGTTSVPEPATSLLLGGGLLAGAMMRRRRKALTA